jgi:GNAT superfamily N-acetyltransferase
MSESELLQHSQVFEPWVKPFTPWSIEFKPMKLQNVIGSLNSISHLKQEHLQGIEDHLIALDERDRYLRFGYHAKDEHIKKYVEGLDVEADRLLGMFSADHRLVAFAHLSLSRPEEFAPCAEFGVSVDSSIRGQGAGSRLFEYACLLARNCGVRMLFIHALSENTAMISIAKKHGATLERQGSETECYVKLPLGDLNSLMIEWSSHYLSQSNLNLQEQSNRFWGFLEHVQIQRQKL